MMMMVMIQTLKRSTSLGTRLDTALTNGTCSRLIRGQGIWRARAAHLSSDLRWLWHKCCAESSLHSQTLKQSSPNRTHTLHTIEQFSFLMFVALRCLSRCTFVNTLGLWTGFPMLGLCGDMYFNFESVSTISTLIRFKRSLHSDSKTGSKWFEFRASTRPSSLYWEIALLQSNENWHQLCKAKVKMIPWPMAAG